MGMVDVLEAGGRLVLFVLDVVDATISPWHWWKDWRRTSSPVSFGLAVFSGTVLVAVVVCLASAAGLF
jgi:hypothetical protein